MCCKRRVDGTILGQFKEDKMKLSIFFPFKHIVWIYSKETELVHMSRK